MTANPSKPEPHAEPMHLRLHSQQLRLPRASHTCGVSASVYVNQSFTQPTRTGQKPEPSRRQHAATALHYRFRLRRIDQMSQI